MTGTFIFWPRSKPIPFGYHYAGELIGNHAGYSILIRRNYWQAVKQILGRFL